VTTSTTKPMKPVVLVVDDEQAVLMVIQVYCRLAGYESILAEDGLQALQATQTISFDLIITDYQMPLMDGIEFCRRLRMGDRNRSTPVIMSSASVIDLDHSALQQELTPITFAAKPFKPQYLPRI
jgi:CheY-like chemotaxis protein